MTTIEINEDKEILIEESIPKNRSRFLPTTLGPAPDTWEPVKGRCQGINRGINAWIFDSVPLHTQALSHEFTLEQGQLYVLELRVDVTYAAPYALVLINAEGNASLPNDWLRYRAMGSIGAACLEFSYSPENTGLYKLALINYFGSYNRGSELQVLDCNILVTTRSKEPDAKNIDTFLPHWGPVRRLLHSRCKRSRLFNAFVAGLEMRLGREESISLPMYLALCPTGQCNALCDFCSVTIKRTGIIKKQLPFDKVQRFLSPTLNTAYMYGIEGNGEPTIYREFDSLLATLIKRGAAAYLITNGSLIESQHIPHLLSLQSMTFSLNAATAETHKKVMKLKDFERITGSIRALIDQRGMNDTPLIFTSFVVHATNAHELQQFLQFAEYDLRVNVIMIRPLSELGAELGVVEDLREIVPYESQIKDALDAACEYLEDIPRRKLAPHSRFACDIRLDPTTFRSVRPDPLDRVILPPGFEGRLLAPRRNDWSSSDPDITAMWSLNQATLHCQPKANHRSTWSSVYTPVEPGKNLIFKANIKVQGKPLLLKILSESKQTLASIEIIATNVVNEISLPFNTAEETRVALEFSNSDGCIADIDFLRLWTPGAGIRKEFKLPFPRRWQIDTPGVQARWMGNVLDISAKENLSGCYLFKSYSNPCASNTRLCLPVKVMVKSGTLVIGTLSENFQSWTSQSIFEQGEHARELFIDTGDNQRLQVVLFAKGVTELKASIDWGNVLEPAPERESGQFIEMPSPVSEEIILNSSQASLKKAVKWKKAAIKKQSKPRFYCQKPWTDINNFTVDGRMDVCCITTGPSQEAYSLGNILKQDFQAIWNGEKMREFRRTVNSDKPLPPCQRCPMAYAYQGPFFNRNDTEAEIERVLTSNIAQRLTLRKFTPKLAHFLSEYVMKVFFKGFKQ